MTGRRILVIEDDPLVRSYVSMVLDTGALDHCGSGDAAKALEMLRAMPEIGLVLLDLTLPRKSGWQVASEIAALRPGLPVVIVSGHAIDASPDAAAQAAVVGFLQKPFTPDQLLVMVRRHLGA